MQRIDKQRVCQQFRRAAASYDRQATIQHRVADRLLTLTAQHIPQRPLMVLEIGCCTGLLTKRLLDNSVIKVRSLVLNDLMPDFAQRLPQDLTTSCNEVHFLPGDIEQLPIAGTFDLIISSSTFHWLDELKQTLTKLLTTLTHEGILAFSLYGPGNLPEIKELTGIGLDYFSQNEIASFLEQQSVLKESHQEKEVFLFPKPRDILNHLRQTGVNSIQRNSWSRKDLYRFCQEYSKRFQIDQAVRLTYHPLYFVAGRSQNDSKIPNQLKSNY